MNKTAIKNFAVWARNKLIADISYRAGLMGITESGIASALPQSTGATEFYDIGTAEPYAISGDAVRQRRLLVELIERKANETDYKTAYKYIIEEVAYTWFNRLIAIRFMEVNDYLPSHIRVLSSESGKMEPDVVTNPFDADLGFTKAEEQQILQLKNDNKLDEVFRILFIKQCNALNEILPRLFERTKDYTELLLSISIVDHEGVVRHLIKDIPEEDFDVERGGQVEIIGWLYQYYNIEPIDETFALLKKNVKITKERVPAATQLFTPDWIVRYMVENSVGRLWIDGHPNTELKDNWKYYLEEAKQEKSVQTAIKKLQEEYQTLNVEDIKIIDPCMGSGHMLIYCFDVLVQIYESQGYSSRDAAQLILEKNLFGLDIDKRAAQLAYFAVMMKARQYDRRIFTRNIKPNVYAIEESNEINGEQLKEFGSSLSLNQRNKAKQELSGLLELLFDAKEYGSILNITNVDWQLLRTFVNDLEDVGQLTLDSIGIYHTQELLNYIIEIGYIMSQKYHVVITNPPYMGASGMNAKLTKYVKTHYPDSKSDLFACFIEKCVEMTIRNGYTSMVTMQSWMFLSSLEKLRTAVIDNNTVMSLLHMENMVMGIAFGTAAFVLNNSVIEEYKGTYNYIKLADIEDGRPVVFPVLNNRFAQVSSNMYREIPGTPIAYWISDNFVKAYRFPKLADLGFARSGLQTGNNDLYLKLWYEVSKDSIAFNMNNKEEYIKSGKKWTPQIKGGSYRKWYGNFDYVVNWENDGAEIRNCNGCRLNALANDELFFKEGLTWSHTTSGGFGARYLPKGHLFNVEAPTYFSETLKLKYVLGMLNSCIAQHYLNAINSTVHYLVGNISALPLLVDERYVSEIERIVDENIALAKEDWDSFENSWDFIGHPLVRGLTSLRISYSEWDAECNRRFNRVKENEYTLNKLFIEIYNLNNELSPEVDDKEITIRKADVGRDIRSLLSYAIGCIFGRYSIDEGGVVYAGGDWNEGNYRRFKPDCDNIIPITDEEYFSDDIIGKLCEWLKVAFSDETLEENLDFIATALGTKGNSSREIIRNYFMNEFIKDHCNTYTLVGAGKRPIYWMFDSGKKNGFKALIYMHRYNEDTIGNLRIDYLHKVQRIYESEINRMQDVIDHSSNSREVTVATKRKEKLQKQHKECREYDEKIGHLALARVEINLDDGVKVNYSKVQTGTDGKKYSVLATI